MILTLVLKKTALFRPKLAKVVDNYDLTIGPGGRFLKNSVLEVAKPDLS
jgi:hypothetical protein